MKDQEVTIMEIETLHTLYLDSHIHVDTLVS
jgi:hypothetical protein